MNLPEFAAAAADLYLESERLVLRAIDEHDLPTAIAHEQDRRIMRWIRDPVPHAALLARIERLMEPWSAADGVWMALAIVPRGHPTMIGILAFRVVSAENQTMEIGYRLSPAAQGRGFAAEACRLLLDHLFGEVRVRKVVAYCVAENEPSWRLLEKLGMQREARFREHSLLDGAWRDEFVYGLLAREWTAESD